MKKRKILALILSTLLVGSAFVSCGKKDESPELSGQTAADIALKKVEQQLSSSKQAKLNFAMEMKGKNEGDETDTSIVDVDGDVTVYVLENSLAWGAELLYAGENKADKLFASNSGVGRLVEDVDAYETVDMLPITATTLGNAFEETVSTLFGSIITSDADTFKENFSAAITANAVREKSKMTLSVTVSDKSFAESVLSGFMSEGAVVSESSMVATIVLDKDKGIVDFGVSGGFSATVTDKEGKCFGRNVQFTDSVTVSYAWDFTSFSTTSATNLPQVESTVFPIYGETWTPLVHRSKSKVTSFIFKLDRVNGQLYYLVEMKLKYRDTKWTYVLEAPAATEKVDSLTFRIRDYLREDAEKNSPYDMDYDFKKSELTQVVTFNWETKEANFKAFKMPRTWTGGYQ